MENKLFDFEKNLEEYSELQYEKRGAKLPVKELEALTDTIFSEWSETVIDELGTTPVAYFRGLDDDTLWAQFFDYYGKNALPAVLMDELCERKSLAQRMIAFLGETKDDGLKETLMSFLDYLGDNSVYPLYISWLLDDNTDDDIALHAIEIMTNNAKLVADELLCAVPSASDKVRGRIADLIVYAPPREESFRLLLERFHSGQDLLLYANYLGMYGDARAIEFLKLKAIDCDYYEYIEIRNSVECLGGILDIYRDFSDDPNYKRIYKKR